MQRNTSAPLWPNLGIVICLFVTSILAVQVWRSFQPMADPGGVPAVAAIPLAAASQQEVEMVVHTRYGATISADQASGSAAEISAQEAPLVQVPLAEVELEVEVAAPRMAEQVAESSAPDWAASTAPASSPRQAPVLVMSTDSPPEGSVLPSQQAPAEPSSSSGSSPGGGAVPADQTSHGELSSHVPIGQLVPPEPPSDQAVPGEGDSSHPKAPDEALGAAPASQPLPSAWPPCETLVGQLQALSDEPCRKWARHALAELQRLQSVPDLAAPEAADILQELRMLEEMAGAALSEVAEIPQRQQLVSAHHALQRRLDVWQGVQQLARQAGDGQSGTGADVATLRHLLATLEQFEQSESLSSTSQLAEIHHRLRFGSSADEAELGRRLAVLYRNANFRFAVSEQLINRLIPDLETVEEPVRDQIMGAAVVGRSATDTRLLVRLVPDRRRISFRLEAQGVVASDTASAKGPVTFFTDGQSAYLAEKLFLLDQSGFRSTRARAQAVSRSRLKGLRSEYDGVLLLGSTVRSIARDQQQEQQPQLRAEVEHRVRSRARSRMDAESLQRLTEVQRRLRAKLVDPLHDLQLEPVALETRTTQHRIIARCRIAGSHQLAAFTPRPQALANSLASVQLHQSLVNNVLQQLALDGTRSDLRELYRRVLDDLNLPYVEVPGELPDRVTIEFAGEDALRVRFSEGRVTLELKIAELVSRSRKWHNFTVRVHYREQLDGLEARLVRDSFIELIGTRLSTLDQAGLRAIFTAVFGRERTVDLIPAAVARDARLAGLQITQYMVVDGWIGLAIGGTSGPTSPLAQNHSAPAAETKKR